MKPKEILIKTLKRSDKERGIRIINPNQELGNSHIKKADHNLVVMTDLHKMGHDDWVAIAAYYAMYHSASALLSSIGLESKDHVATVSALEYFFGKEISKEILKIFNDMHERNEYVGNLEIEGRYIDKIWKAKRERENVQYGIELTYKKADSIIRDARDFVSRMKLVMEGLDEKIVKIIVEKIKELKEESLKK